MDIARLIPDNYPEYTKRFTKHSYPACFEEYRAMSEVIFNEIELSGQTESAAAQLLERAEGMLGRWRRSMKIFDIRQFLFLYTMPAALDRSSELSQDFARQVQKLWNQRFPKEPLNLVGFRELFAGFRNKIFGFDIGSD